LRIEVLPGVIPRAENSMSHSQQGLIDIMQRVKNRELTVQQAETEFNHWQVRNEKGFTRSFKERKVSMTFLNKCA
jgi:hypothetical protein